MRHGFAFFFSLSTFVGKGIMGATMTWEGDRDDRSVSPRTLFWMSSGEAVASWTCWVSPSLP